MQVIREEIAKLSSADTGQVDEIISHLSPVKLSKGQCLLRIGQICCQYYFIERGVVRLYYQKEDNDYTVWMGTPGQIFTNLESYLDQEKSNVAIEAYEPALVYVIDKRSSDKLAEHSNAYNTLLRRTVEIAFVQLSKNVMSFQSEEAEERYQRVAKEKDWLSRYPLKYVSSFIGVTQSSLSRIRAKKR